MPRMLPIHTRVVDAFLLSGFWNEGTPFDTASTPDRATAPDEKARKQHEKAEMLGLLGDLDGVLGRGASPGSARDAGRRPGTDR